MVSSTLCCPQEGKKITLLKELLANLSQVNGLTERFARVGPTRRGRFDRRAQRTSSDVMFGKNGVLDELRQWKESGRVRFVSATAHDQSLARRLAADPRVGVLRRKREAARFGII
jgi:hypothetical protein